MTGRHRRPPRGPYRPSIAAMWTTTLVLTALATLSASLVTLSRPVAVGGRAATGSIAGSVGAPDAGQLHTAAQPAVAVSAVRLHIEKLGVSTRLVPLGLDQSGALTPPDSPAVAGWFADGPVPGDVGPAVVAGHVDSAAGPGVFFLLQTLQLGDRIEVERSDGRTVVFAVTSIRRFGKDEFPTKEVYGPTPVPELRLITCGGPFDRVGGRYVDNVIVHAVAVS